jgi:hypothetical protein
MYIGSRPRDSRRGWIWLGVAATIGYGLIGATSSNEEPATDEVAITEPAVTTTEAAPTTTTTRPPTTTTTARPTTTTTARPTTTTTVPEAERGGDDPNPGELFADRPDIQDNDHERAVGPEPIRFSGYSVSVLSVEYVERAGQFECCGYLRVRVRMLNRDDEQQSWSRLDFTLLRPSGEVYSPAIVVEPNDQLGISGGLVHGGVVEGDVWFSVDPGEMGRYYIYWEPSLELFEEDRGIWRFERS